MAEKRVSVRLAAVGGRRVRAELEGVGEDGTRGFGRLSREMEAANVPLAVFSATAHSRSTSQSIRLPAPALKAGFSFSDAPMTTTFHSHWRDVLESVWRWPNVSPAEIARHGAGVVDRLAVLAAS